MSARPTQVPAPNQHLEHHHAQTARGRVKEEINSQGAARKKKKHFYETENTLVIKNYTLFSYKFHDGLVVKESACNTADAGSQV